jgi:hypothetical protein
MAITFYSNFKSDGRDDLQTVDAKGLPYSAPHFRREYRRVASFNYGLAAASAGMPLMVAELAGGLYNLRKREKELGDAYRSGLVIGFTAGFNHMQGPIVRGLAGAFKNLSEAWRKPKIKTSGKFWNHPNNPRHIEAGYNYAKGKRKDIRFHVSSPPPPPPPSPPKIW